jgi:hypothetical protein
MISVIGIANVAAVVVVETNYIHLILVHDDLMMLLTMITNIDFDRVVGY